MCYIELKSGIYCKGFDSCVKMELSNTKVIEIKDNMESVYLLERCSLERAQAFLRSDFKSDCMLGFYRMSQDVYNQRLVRFVNKVAANHKDFTFTDRSRMILSKFAILGYFRGSLSLSAEAFSQKIIAIHAGKLSSPQSGCDVTSKTGS